MAQADQMAASSSVGGDPDFDVAVYGRELADFLDQAVRAATRAPNCLLRREHEQRIGCPAGRGPAGRRFRGGPGDDGALVIRGLSKRFGGTAAVVDVDLAVARGAGRGCSCSMSRSRPSTPCRLSSFH